MHIVSLIYGSKKKIHEHTDTDPKKAQRLKKSVVLIARNLRSHTSLWKHISISVKNEYSS